MACLSPSNVPFSKPPVGWREPARRGTRDSTFVPHENARQGVHGKALAYVLATSILLLLITYALFGLFSDRIVVTDLPAASAAQGDPSGQPLPNSNLQGSSPAQQATVQQR